MNLEKLIADLKDSIEKNIEIGDKCAICREEYEPESDQSDCAGCWVNDCETYSEKYRSYQMCEEFYTDSWITHAFSDIGADLKPKDYGFVDYYGDEITDDEEKELDSAMEIFCQQFGEEKKEK